MTIYITELITGAIYTVALFYWIKNEGDPCLLYTSDAADE